MSRLDSAVRSQAGQYLSTGQGSERNSGLGFGNGGLNMHGSSSRGAVVSGGPATRFHGPSVPSAVGSVGRGVHSSHPSGLGDFRLYNPVAGVRKVKRGKFL